MDEPRATQPFPSSSSDEARVLEVAPEDNVLARVENEVHVFGVGGARHVVVHLALGILVHLWFSRERESGEEGGEREGARETGRERRGCGGPGAPVSTSCFSWVRFRGLASVVLEKIVLEKYHYNVPPRDYSLAISMRA